MAWWWPDELPADPTPARRSYVVCGTPRAGTWLLCGLLAGTGVAGRPHEWFWRDTEADYRRRWGVTTFDGYLRAVLAAGTGPNGVFGAKLMWGSFPELLARLRDSRRARSDRELLELVFPKPRFVRVVRRDVVAQAVSFDRAIRTGHWHHWDPPPAPVSLEFDFDRVDHLVRELRAHDAAWTDWFARHEVQPLELVYEDVVDDMEAAVRRTLAFLDLVVPPLLRVSPGTERQGDALNAEWARLYRERTT